MKTKPTNQIEKYKANRPVFIGVTGQSVFMITCTAIPCKDKPGWIVGLPMDDEENCTHVLKRRDALKHLAEMCNVIYEVTGVHKSNIINEVPTS